MRKDHLGRSCLDFDVSGQRRTVGGDLAFAVAVCVLRGFKKNLLFASYLTEIAVSRTHNSVIS